MILWFIPFINYELQVINDGKTNVELSITNDE
jgi:hypothetical protein